MRVSTQIAFKEWAVVVDALGRGEQLLILRKGGLHESHGQFQVEHHGFWLFPTQYHEAEQHVLPAQHARVRELAAHDPGAPIPIHYYAVADPVLPITDAALLDRLTGHHIWTTATLRQRFAYGNAPGLHALVVRVYRRPSPVTIPWHKNYGGCRSWVTLESPLTGDVTPVLPDDTFTARQDQLCQLLEPHALAHS